MKLKSVLLAVNLLADLFYVKAQSGTAGLLPVPSEIHWNNGKYPVTACFNLALKTEKYDSVLYAAANRFFQTLNRRTALYFNTEYITQAIKPDSANLVVMAHSLSVADVGLDESYRIEINSRGIRLDAQSTEGALHGLETILQLVYDDGGRFYLPYVTMVDTPRFAWRGMMIDVARHFIPVQVIKRNLDAMASVKMNVLHIHLSDDEGFRVESKRFPLLQANGSNGQYYSQAEIKDIISYARLRGIMVVPEFDMPGHTTSWLAAYPWLASAPGSYVPGPRFKNLKNTQNIGEIMKMINSTPTPTMDPTRDSTYILLDQFFDEMSLLFPSRYVHVGFDENNGIAWMNNPSIVSFMKKNGFADAHSLQGYFAGRVSELLAQHNKITIGWEEILTGNTSKNILVQVWNDGQSLKRASANGNKVIISKGFYLDQFMPAYVCYNNDIFSSLSTDQSARFVMGAEAAMWTEAADKSNIETRIWPRAAAIAERMWSPARIHDVEDLYRRLYIVNRQLDENGLDQLGSYERNLRRLTAGENISPLKMLTDVLTPVKGYKKLMARMAKPASYAYQTTPLIAVSDIVPVDSETKRAFRKLVEDYLNSRNAVSETGLIKQLTEWRDNAKDLQIYFDRSELISQIRQQSDHLHEAALIGLEAMDKNRSPNKPSQEWINEKMRRLDEFKKSVAETNLDIIPEIEGLVKQQLAAEPATYPPF